MKALVAALERIATALEQLVPALTQATREARRGLVLKEETEEDYVCCSRGLPSDHDPEVVLRRRWVSEWSDA